jgi:peptidoglycan hydrolase CwlO-like protein
MPITHPVLEESIKTQRLTKYEHDWAEDDEIARGDVERVVYNLQSHIKLILRLIKAKHNAMNEHKKEASSLKTEIFELRQKLVDENEHVLVELSPEIMKNYKVLKKQIHHQKNDTEMQYKELLKLKKSIASSQQLLDDETATVKLLEDAILGNVDNVEDLSVDC